MTNATAMQKADFSNADEQHLGLVSKRTIELDGLTVVQSTFNVGARWSTDVKQYAHTDACEVPHVAVITAGTLGAEMVDGSTGEFTVGEVMVLPAGHDAWCVGAIPCTFVEFSRGSDIYAA